MRIGKIYTRGGDKGESSLVSGERLSKGDLQFEGVGSLDELNSQFGMLVSLYLQEDLEHNQEVLAVAKDCQDTLFDLGSILACNPERIAPTLPKLKADLVAKMEAQIDALGSNLPVLPSFVIPGGCVINAQAHICRTVCRRVERVIVRLKGQLADEQVLPAMEFVNRLSDWFFVFSRWISAQKNVPEVLWEHGIKKRK